MDDGIGDTCNRNDKKPDFQTCISPGAIGCECTEAEAAMAATSPAIPVPAAIIWGAECVIDFLQL